MSQNCRITRADRELLRALAGRVAEYAARPVEDKKRALWTAHNDLKTSEPVVFIDPENGWHEIITDTVLTCEGPLARAWEFALRRLIFHAEHLKDDRVIDARFAVGHVYSNTGWGVNIQHIGGSDGGAYQVKQAIEDYEEDFEKLHFPKIVIDWQATAEVLAQARDVFDGILDVELRTAWWWSMGLTKDYIDLRGLEDFMCDFVLEPDWVHRMMELLCRGTLDMLDKLDWDGLLSSNVGNVYVGSGGFGFTNDLPERHGGERVRPMDMWGFVESQETVSVSPEMYAEFVLPYHMRIAERFGLNCFGCCEPFEARWNDAKALPRIRRVSVSPWSDRSRTEELLGMRYIASHKLIPTPLSRPVMNEDEVRGHLREAVRSSRNCVPEFIMKDNHTLGGNPQNAVRWVEIAREEIARL